MSRVAFTRFCRQIRQSARIGVRGGGSSQSWKCQDFESSCYGKKDKRDKEDKEDNEDSDEVMRITMRTSDPSLQWQCPLKTCSTVFTKHQSIIGWSSAKMTKNKKLQGKLMLNFSWSAMFGLNCNLIETNIHDSGSCCNFLYILFQLH